MTQIADRQTAIVQRLAEGLDDGLVPVGIFGDEDVFRSELENIFAKSWLFLALENEIAQPGDYVLRRMGSDEVIVSRTSDGSVAVMLNKCRHRGTIICRDDKGNSSHFRCAYHGWTYSNDGSWTGAPKRPRAYRNLDPKQWGLLRAVKVEIRWGLIFACIDDSAPDFDESVGDALWYLEAFFGLDSRGLISLGDPNRWVARTNWKSGSENIGGDNYHVATAHASATEIGALPDLRDANEVNAQFATDEGHVFTATAPFPPESGLGPFGHPVAVWESFDRHGLDDAHLKLQASHFLFTGNVFPNFSLFRSLGPPLADGHIPTYTMLRTWQPIGPDQTEVWNWICCYSVEPEQYRDAAYAAGMQMLGPAGLIEQDDMAVWEGTAVAGSSVMAEKLDMHFNYQLGIDGMSAGGPSDRFAVPGTAVELSYNEGNQRTFLRRWLAMMTGVQA